MLLENLAFVFRVGLVTALATGLGALPFLIVEEIGDCRNVVLRDGAAGIRLNRRRRPLALARAGHVSISTAAPGRPSAVQ